MTTANIKVSQNQNPSYRHNHFHSSFDFVIATASSLKISIYCYLVLILSYPVGYSDLSFGYDKKKLGVHYIYFGIDGLRLHLQNCLTYTQWP